MAEAKKGFNVKALLKIITGIVAILAGAWVVWVWRFDVLVLVRGCVGFALILVGAIFLAIAKE